MLVDRAVMLGKRLLIMSNDSSSGYDVSSGCRFFMTRTYATKDDQLGIPLGWLGLAVDTSWWTRR
ncbi:unnamed protein product [Lupinus luteus]|uniref:Uncharacterized protein n=1 Tax=Lupinus luteus TaxID=3873 RepID=A0AAV1Y1G5_LUPLU